MNVNQLIDSIEKKLSPQFSDSTLSTQYAWWLLQAITGKDELALISGPLIWDETAQHKLDAALNALINKNMPLQYLLGSTPFCGLDILVQPPILIPRPETEEWCANLIDKLYPLRREPLRILDLCTGSGCIALALADAFGNAKVMGTDSNPQAIALARENARHNQISNVTFLESDLFAEIPDQLTFDLIVGNPPYISPKDWNSLDKSVTQWEDKNALIAQDEGLALIKKIIKEAPVYIHPNALLKDAHIAQLVLEMDCTQAVAVTEYMNMHDYNEIYIYKDLEGKDRILTGRLDNVAITQNNT